MVIGVLDAVCGLPDGLDGGIDCILKLLNQRNMKGAPKPVAISATLLRRKVQWQAEVASGAPKSHDGAGVEVVLMVSLQAAEGPPAGSEPYSRLFHAAAWSRCPCMVSQIDLIPLHSRLTPNVLKAFVVSGVSRRLPRSLLLLLNSIHRTLALPRESAPIC